MELWVINSWLSFCKVWSLLSLHGASVSFLYGLAVLRVHVLNMERVAYPSAVNAHRGGRLRFCLKWGTGVRSAVTQAWLWWAQIWREAILKDSHGLGKETVGMLQSLAIFQLFTLWSPVSIPPGILSPSPHSLHSMGPSFHHGGRGHRTPPFQVPPFLRATQDREERGNMCQNSRFGVLNVASLGPLLPTTILTPMTDFCRWLFVSTKEQRCTFLGSVLDLLHKHYYCLLLSTAKKSVLCVLYPCRLTNFMHHSYPLKHFFNLRQMEFKSSVHTAVLNNTWWPQTAP